MLIQTLRLQGLLSFGVDEVELPLRPLNLLIGPNGSGKSNVLDALGLLRAAPRDLLLPFREGGGVREWIFKGDPAAGMAAVEVVVDNVEERPPLLYHLAFAERAQRFELQDERVEFAATADTKVPHFHYRFDNGQGLLNVSGQLQQLGIEEVETNQSILSQRRDPGLYPEISYLARVFDRIRIYRDWSFGRNTPPRRPQDAALPNDQLAEDCSNLGLVLSRLRREPRVKARLLEALRMLYDGIDDYEVVVEGGTVQVFFQEGSRSIPATRLSDGTLRYLCLLTILCHPSPPPLVCIEEPELGLHPDILPTLATLLREASQRCQLIVTTHSDVLVDAMTDDPEAVVVVERGPQGSTLKRLDAQTLQPWLKDYRLGTLWTRGDIGGTRW